MCLSVCLSVCLSGLCCFAPRGGPNLTEWDASPTVLHRFESSHNDVRTGTSSQPSSGWERASDRALCVCRGGMCIHLFSVYARGSCPRIILWVSLYRCLPQQFRPEPADRTDTTQLGKPPLARHVRDYAVAGTCLLLPEFVIGSVVVIIPVCLFMVCLPSCVVQ